MLREGRFRVGLFRSWRDILHWRAPWTLCLRGLCRLGRHQSTATPLIRLRRARAPCRNVSQRLVLRERRLRIGLLRIGLTDVLFLDFLHWFPPSQSGFRQ